MGSIPQIVNQLKDTKLTVRPCAMSLLVHLASHGKLRFRTTYSLYAANKVNEVEFFDTIQAAIPELVKGFADQVTVKPVGQVTVKPVDQVTVKLAAIKAFVDLASYSKLVSRTVLAQLSKNAVEFREGLQAAIPSLIKLFKGQDSGVAAATAKAFVSLASYGKLHGPDHRHHINWRLSGTS